MPRFDGMGPRGAGPMTGRGEGYCVLQFPEPGRLARGYAGLERMPIGPEAQAGMGPLVGALRGWRNPLRLSAAGCGPNRLPFPVPASSTYAYGFGPPRRAWGRGFLGWSCGPCRGQGWGRGHGSWW